ncbi:hypothetical protein BJ170DRAFT_342855 [Xylariales sp. AK1849]|nr:hypothetical protein BJ170DRAFT_342855 [Xylariales sp. AK1849]
MSGPQISPVLSAWYKWKALRLPWRKRFLVGLDLNNNTYWTFRDAGSSPTSRWRRIVKYPSSTHYSEVSVPPQWHQWLRYQRESPPSLAEQAQDVARQGRMKVLAAEADARWEAKPSLSDVPGRENGQAVPALDTGRTRPQEQDRNLNEAEVEGRKGTKTDIKNDPWKKAASGPSENWQPGAWSPTSTRKR